MTTLSETKAQLEVARAKYLEIVHTAPAPEVRAASDVVKSLQGKLSECITAGAKPCPTCEAPPHGMEQPNTRGGVEFEIGCIGCGAFEHTDGSIREHRVRGGMMPSHAVDAWNAGPDFWQRQSPAKRAASAPVTPELTTQ